MWQLVANSPKPGKSQRKYTVTHVVTHSSYGNVLHYGLSMFESLVMCGNTFNMAEIEITKVKATFRNMDRP